MLQCVAVRCSALQCVAVCCSVLQCVALRCSVLQCIAVRCSALQCVAVCCSVQVHCNACHRYPTIHPVTYMTIHHTIGCVHDTLCVDIIHTTTHNPAIQYSVSDLYMYLYIPPRYPATHHTSSGCIFQCPWYPAIQHPSLGAVPPPSTCVVLRGTKGIRSTSHPLGTPQYNTPPWGLSHPRGDVLYWGVPRCIAEY